MSLLSMSLHALPLSGPSLALSDKSSRSRLPLSASSAKKISLPQASRRMSGTRRPSGVASASLSRSLSLSALTESEKQQMAEILRLATIESHHLTVAECMTQGQLIVAQSDTSVYEALESLVANRITGMPVVDSEYRVVGVVSDYDLLALDSIYGSIASCDKQAAAATVDAAAHDLFPSPKSSWKAFREIQRLLHKAHGQTVGDVMTANPLTVRPLTNLENAARLLLDTKYRRLPVCDEDGKLLGMLTRGNVVRAALMMRRAAEGRGMAPAGGN